MPDGHVPAPAPMPALAMRGTRTMKLRCDPAAPVNRGILLFAAEEGIPIEIESVSLFAAAQLAPGFAAVNPERSVSVLEDGAFRLTGGSAILTYLADSVLSPAYPAALQARARVNALLDWFHTGFHRAFAYGFVLPQAVPAYAWPEPAMQAASIRQAERRARAMLEMLDRDWLAAAGGPFLGGAAPCLADYTGATHVTLGELVEFDLWPWPRVAAWVAAMKARPQWPAANAAFDAWRRQLGRAAAA